MALTKQQLTYELRRCAKQPAEGESYDSSGAIYFMKKFGYISHPVRGKIHFDMFPFQEEATQLFDENRFAIILKARQLGFSTLLAMYVTWLMLFKRDQVIIIISKDAAAAKGLIRKIKYALKALPYEFKRAFGINREDKKRRGDVKLVADNVHTLELPNGSTVKAMAPTDNAGTSESTSLLVIDEAAKIQNLDTIWTSAYPTISTGGRAIVFSTPFGVGGMFHKMYTDCIEGRNDFVALRPLMWFEHPDRDDEWFETETRNFSKKKIAQEYECSFLFSGDTVISGHRLEVLEAAAISDWRTDERDNRIWVYERYKPGKKYVIGSDVARGDGDDYSSFVVLDVEEVKVAADFKGRLKPTAFGQALVDIGNEYGSCAISVENTGIGWATAEKLEELRYPALIYTMKGKPAEHVLVKYGTHRKDIVCGFTMSGIVRPLVISRMQEWVEPGSETEAAIPRLPPRLIEELKTFIWLHSKPQHMRGYHDDLIIAYSQTLWLRDKIIMINDSREAEAMLDGMSVGVQTMSDVTGYKSDEFAPTRPNQQSLKAKTKSVYGVDLDFSWLMG